MVKFYVRRILVEKKMTIDEVPARWREAVRKELEVVEEQFHLKLFEEGYTLNDDGTVSKLDNVNYGGDTI